MTKRMLIPVGLEASTNGLWALDYELALRSNYLPVASMRRLEMPAARHREHFDRLQTLRQDEELRITRGTNAGDERGVSVFSN